MITGKYYYRTLCLIFGFVLITAGCFAFISLLVFLFSLGEDGVLFSLGTLLFNTFGFSSFLIPVFFLTASVMLFIPGWSMVRGGYLIFFLVPFFTVFAGEKLSGIYPPHPLVEFFTPKGIVILSILLGVLEYAALYFIINFPVWGKRDLPGDSEEGGAEPEIGDTVLQEDSASPDENIGYQDSFVSGEDSFIPEKNEETGGMEESGKKYRPMTATLQKLKDLLGFETDTTRHEEELIETVKDEDSPVSADTKDTEDGVVPGGKVVMPEEKDDIAVCDTPADSGIFSSGESNTGMKNSSSSLDFSPGDVENKPGKVLTEETVFYTNEEDAENNAGFVQGSGDAVSPDYEKTGTIVPPLSRDSREDVTDKPESDRTPLSETGTNSTGSVSEKTESDSTPVDFPEYKAGEKINFLDSASKGQETEEDSESESFYEDPLEVKKRVSEYQSVLFGDKQPEQDEDMPDFYGGEDDLSETGGEEVSDDYDEVPDDDYPEEELEEPMGNGGFEPDKEYSSVSGSDSGGKTALKPGSSAKRLSVKNYRLPAADLLTSYQDGEYWIIDDATRDSAVVLKKTLEEFKIQADVTGIRKGPVITMFEILPAPGVKLQKIVALQDNIALRLAASSVRIIAPIPGKHAVGIEVPNSKRSIVSFRELIDTDAPQFKKMEIPVVLGKDITGEAQYLDLATTPHLLIAGSTGAGKSVCVNSMILSILFKRSPLDVRLILIDPKIVELKLYNDIPHLLTPVITEPKKAFQALQYCLCEMERRYALLDGMGVRDIRSYNRRIKERNIATEKLPYIVVIIDEFADLMATTGKELESTVARLAAMSRAVGIHLVLATQRPSIDVITGLIKANIPSRIAFMVASKMDSRIIIDQVGAEKLLGKGDMLYASATESFPVRIQGAFVTDNEVEKVVDFVKQYGEPDYIDDEIFFDDEDPEAGPSLFSDGEDPLYDKALEIVMQAGKASASYIQRRLKIGYNRAARLVEEMEERGIVGPANGSKPRDVIHRV